MEWLNDSGEILESKLLYKFIFMFCLYWLFLEVFLGLAICCYGLFLFYIKEFVFGASNDKSIYYGSLSQGSYVVSFPSKLMQSNSSMYSGSFIFWGG